MQDRRARFHFPPKAKLHIDTHVAIPLTAQREAETKPLPDDEKHGAYRRRRLRRGIVTEGSTPSLAEYPDTPVAIVAPCRPRRALPP